MKKPNLFLLLSLISFLSVILVTGSTLKSYTNFYENNNLILLKLPTIYAHVNSDDLEDGGIFPDLKTDDKDGKEKDGGGDGGKEKDGGGDGRTNENTNNFSPLSSGSPKNTDDKVNPNNKVNPYGSPINTDDKVNPNNKVGPQLGQQSKQEVKESVQVDQQSGQQVYQQTNGTNQTEEQQTIGTNQTEEHQTIGNEINQTEEQQDTGK